MCATCLYQEVRWAWCFLVLPPLSMSQEAKEPYWPALLRHIFFSSKSHCFFDALRFQPSTLAYMSVRRQHINHRRNALLNQTTNEAVVWNVCRVHSCCWVYSLAKLVFMVSPLKQLWSSRFVCTWQGGRHALAACRSKSNGLCFPKVLTQSNGSC